MTTHRTLIMGSRGSGRTTAICERLNAAAYTLDTAAWLYVDSAAMCRHIDELLIARGMTRVNTKTMAQFGVPRDAGDKVIGFDLATPLRFTWEMTAQLTADEIMVTMDAPGPLVIVRAPLDSTHGATIEGRRA